MKKLYKIFYWLPRILCICAIIFISLFALDSFDNQYSFLEQVGGFFIHLVPSYILIAILLIAWKWEVLGGILFTLLGLIFIPFIFSNNYDMNQSIWISLSVVLTINMPFVIVGILFIISHFIKKRIN